MSHHELTSCSLNTVQRRKSCAFLEIYHSFQALAADNIPVPLESTAEALSFLSQDEVKMPETASKSFTSSTGRWTKPPLVATLQASPFEPNSVRNFIPSTMLAFSPFQEPYSKPSVHLVNPPTISAPPNFNSTAGSVPPLMTALSSRKTEVIIADLKRPLHTSSPTSAKHRRSSLFADAPPTSNPNDGLQQSNGPDTNGDKMHEPDYLEAYDDNDKDNEVLPPAKLQKISERKRRMNAIADSYIHDMAQKSLNEDIRASCQNMDDQSARYIVQQVESQKIISTPREYQTELFERAKEKNIIAVLDTGEQLKGLIDA
jgi:hypothetical protein